MDQEINRILEIDSSSDAPAIGETSGSPEKIGGWLFFPAIGLILGGILSVVGIVMSMEALSKMASYLPSRYQGVFTLNLLVNTGITVFLIYAAVRFFGKKRNAPRIMIVLMITNVTANGLLLAINVGADAGPLAVECGKALAKGVVGAAIWVPYFLVSKRVKRTFVIP